MILLKHLFQQIFKQFVVIIFLLIMNEQINFLKKPKFLKLKKELEQLKQLQQEIYANNLFFIKMLLRIWRKTYFELQLDFLKDFKLVNHSFLSY